MPLPDYVALGGRTDDYVELGRTKQGRLFRKQILKYGKFAHPQDRTQVFEIDRTRAEQIKSNFEAGMPDIVQIPVVLDSNQHTEDPDRNAGEVIGVEVDDKGVYAIMDIRDAARAEKVGSTYIGASASLALDYKNPQGESVGPALIHVAITNHPYLKGLESYEAILNASADVKPTVLLTPEEPMGLDELKAQLKDEHQIDLDDIQTKLAAVPSEADIKKIAASAVDEYKTKVMEALGQKVEQKDIENTEVDKIVAAAMSTLKEQNVALSTSVQELQKANAISEVEALVRSGHVLPAQKDVMVELKLTSPDIFKQLIPAEPVVKLDMSQGKEEPHSASEADEEKWEKEIADLSTKYSDIIGLSKKES